MARNRFHDDEELFGDLPMGGDQAPEPTPSPVRRPKLSKEERATKQKQDLRERASQIGMATRGRRQWEESPQGQARTKDINDLATEHYNAERAKRGMAPIGRTAMSKPQLYSALGVTNEGHGAGSQQLPGFENPHSAPEPPRWEDLPAAKQKKTQENLRLTGTNMEQMKNDFGAQFDQSIWRAHQAGHHNVREVQDPPVIDRMDKTKSGFSNPVYREGSGGSHTEREPTPFTAHFYGEHPDTAPEPLDRPKQMFRESRQHLAGEGINIDPMVQVASVAHTSPNLKFTQGERGNRSSPNIEAAESVIKQHSEGVPSYEVTSGKNRRGITNQTRPANARRTARMLEHVDAGQPLATSRNAPSVSSPEGSSQWGPKTGPFANSFDATHPDYLVGDVHTLGGGMFPHLSTSKPVATHPETGERYRTKAFASDPRPDAQLANEVGERIAFRTDKSQREKAIVTAGTTAPPDLAPTFKGKAVSAHAAADHAARQAIAERGLGSSVRRPQASQWGEEQIQRKEASPKLDVPSHEDAYPSQRHVVNESQMKLFS